MSKFRPIWIWRFIWLIPIMAMRCLFVLLILIAYGFRGAKNAWRWTA